MGYYMRYVVSDPQPVTVEEVEQIFLAEEDDYVLETSEREAMLHHGEHLLARIELNLPSILQQRGVRLTRNSASRPDSDLPQPRKE